MKTRQRGNTVIGLIIGIVLGLGVALGIAVYVTKVPIPFMTKTQRGGAEQDEAEARKNKDWNPNAPLAGKPSARTTPEQPASVGPLNPAAPATGPVPAVVAPDARSAAASAARARPDTGAPAASSDPLGDEPTCVTNATSGWIVFQDTDGNCKRGLTEAVIDARKLENDNTANLLRVKYDGDCLSFAPTGFRQAIAGTTPVNHILMCDNRGITKAAGTTLSAARGIIISPTGRARVTRDVSGGLADDITKWGPAGVCP